MKMLFAMIKRKISFWNVQSACIYKIYFKLKVGGSNVQIQNNMFIKEYFIREALL